MEVEVVDRDIEKSLHLLSMQIHRQNAMHAGCVQKIRDQLRCDRHARFVLSVLARISEKRNDRGDAIGAGPSRRIHHDEQLHQVIVGWRTRRLNNENIAATNVLLDFDVGLAVRERADRGLAPAARRPVLQMRWASSRLAEPLNTFISG